MDHTGHVLAFIRDTHWQDLPGDVRHQSKRCLLDTLGALIPGQHTPVAALMEGVARTQFPGNQASVLVRGTPLSASGAALVNGFAGNALDIDDGYRDIKGHPGACVLPVVLAAAQMAGQTSGPVSGPEFLTALIIGYETGIRAGLIRHATYDTYHSSGSWGAVSGAAAAGRLLGLSQERLCHALGAAEYHAPIAPMMKCIETPSMGKDSIGWGCMTAMMSVLMADRGFTGICPLFKDSPQKDWVTSLGRSWEIMHLYVKPYAACRWAQPGVDGALKLMEDHGLAPDDIEAVEVFTFREAAALSQAHPKNTEEAQYNIPFPIAAALVDKKVGPAQVLPPGLFDPRIRFLMDRITITPQDRFQKAFPQKAESEVRLTTRDGRTFVSGEMPARWDPASGLPTDRELGDKFMWLAAPVLGQDAAEKIRDCVMHFEQETDAARLITLCSSKGEFNG